MEKVTDPKKIVTDALVLKRLAEHGIDKDYVEFWRDYAPRSRGKEHSPYAKFYRDLKSGKRVMVTSGLPKVKPDGTKIEVGWIKQGNRYASKPNLFSAVVNNKQVRVTCLNDQPDGRKEDDWLQWEPQLFFNGIEQLPLTNEPVLLAVDSANPELSLNTLEWDYDVCKRRLRVIEGRIREKWIIYFKGMHEIVHNPTGNLPLRYGYATRADGLPLTVQVIGNKEILDTSGLPDSAFPVVIGASPETFFPDAHEESNSVDGTVTEFDSGQDWSWFVAAPGDDFDDDQTTNIILILASSTLDKFSRLQRTIVLFDTSGLPNNADISAVTLSLYGQNKSDGLSITPDINIYSSAPASSTALAAGDFDSLGSEDLSTLITFGSWSTAGYNDFALIDVNTDGFATNAGGTYISKTSVTELGARNANYDVAEEVSSPAVPSWSSGSQSFFVSYAADNGSNQPKLVVTYTSAAIIPPGGSPLAQMIQAGLV